MLNRKLKPLRNKLKNERKENKMKIKDLMKNEHIKFERPSI